MAIAPFNSTTQTEFVKKSKIELYHQIYPIAAEDFASTADFKTESDAINRWQSVVERQIKELGNQLVKHTHQITPHVHDIPPHEHSWAGGNAGGPVSGITFAGTLVSSLPTIQGSIQTQVAINSSALQWNPTQPVAFVGNTTGAVSNLSQNTITYGTSGQGDLTTVEKRRSKTDLALSKPITSPTMTAAAVAGIA